MKCVQHQPEPGNITRDKDGEPADLLSLRDYPIRSACMLCQVEIITYGMFGRAADWYEMEESDAPVMYPRGGWSISG